MKCTSDELREKLTIFVPRCGPDQSLIIFKKRKTLRQIEQEICCRNHLLFQQYNVILNIRANIIPE